MSQNDIEFAQGKGDTRQNWIDNIIAESKKRKAERQRDAEEADTLTKDLNDKWKNVFGELKSTGKVYQKADLLEKLRREDAAAKDVDPYDKLMGELTFEKGKQQATERLKTDEEIVQEDRDRLEKLEKERLKRMRGEIGGQESEGEEEAAEEEEEDDSDGGEEEEEEDENSDLEESESEDEESKGKPIKINKLPPELKAKIMAAAQEEIPYTFKLPETFEELQGHLANRTPAGHATVVERIIKCNHPQFGNHNREKLQGLFAFLLQYIHDCADDVDGDEERDGSSSVNLLETIYAILPFLYDLAQFSPAPSAKAVLSVLQEKFEEYNKQPKKTLGFEVVSAF